MLQRVLAFLLFLIPGVAVHAQEDASPEPLTVAEQMDYARTGTSADVEAFLREIDARSERTFLTSIGTSNEGRDLWMLAVSDPPVTTPEEARKSGKLIVLMFGNIHAGETCGKEALQMLARELALGERPDLLDDLIVLLVPNYNPDGNDRMAPDNRPGQHGPDEMGERANAQGLDLNRDWIKMEAPETRALVRVFRTWDPAVIVDTHTTNGSNHGYTITYQGNKHPAGDRALLEFVRDDFLPAVDARFEEESSYKAFWYGNFADNHTKWTTYPADPRYGTPYRGLRNRVAILSEAYAYASFRDRVLGTLAFCRSILAETRAKKDQIQRLIREADERTICLGEHPGEEVLLPLRVRPRAFEQKETVLGVQEYDEEGNRIEPTGEVREYEVEVINDFEPVLSVRRAWGYVLPSSHLHVLELLQRHGIRVEEILEDMEIDAEVYRIDEVTRSERVFQGHAIVRVEKATPMRRTLRLTPGMYLVRSAQPLGTLAGYMLEPQATDGLTAWNFFDDAMALGAEFPVARLLEPVAITRTNAPPLEEDRRPPEPLSFENLFGSGKRPNLNGTGTRILRWLDDEHYLQEKDGKPWKVHALTGRVEAWQDPAAGVAERLGEHPAISQDAARRLARQFAQSDPDKGVVFQHAGDLFHARSDGSQVVRLTRSPQSEEVWQVSPDGQWVAFVRDNDLWVAHTRLGEARPLTTGGTDLVRNGKASWLYYEELFGRSWRAFWWSPDSTRICYLQTDSSSVPVYTIVDNSRREQRIEQERYARPGERNPHVEAFIVDVAGGSPRRIDLADYDDGAYLISHVSWTPDARHVVLHVQNRIQTWLDILRVPADGATPERVLRDSTRAWIDSPGNAHYLGDGSWLLFSERDGYRHLYHYDKDGSLLGQITSGPWEVRSIVRVDENEGWIYFMGTRDSSIQSHLYRVSLDGGDPVRLTPEGGSHRVMMSPDGRLFIDTWSSLHEPTRVCLRSSEDGSIIRWINTNPAYEREQFELGDIELVQIPARDDRPALEGIIHYPPHFDPSKRYPVWVMTYAGPHAPTVRDSWQGGRTWERLLCAAGIVVLRTDPYPASGKGAVSAWESYKRLGVRELQDLEDAVDWICTHDWADATRVGISGHSFGGFITSYALTHSDRFSAGIAGAPVTDWRDYDTIYTERYMSTPQDNPEGYRETSVVEGAKGLHGRLLIAHGTIDDNVHMHNSIRLISALQRAGKIFETAIYPGSRHAIRSRQYRALQWEFIQRTMRVGEFAPQGTPPPNGDAPPHSEEHRPHEDMLGPSARNP